MDERPVERRREPHLRDLYEQVGDDPVDNYYEQDFEAVRAKFEEELADGSFGPVHPLENR